MPKGKRFRVNEVHSILDMLESDPDFLTANLYVLPPADPECSDEDSGDEDKGAPDNLSRRQLEAEAEVTVWKGNKRERLFSPDDNDVLIPTTPDQSALQSTPSTSGSGSQHRRSASVVSIAASSSPCGSINESLHPLDIQQNSTTTATTTGKKIELEKKVLLRRLYRHQHRPQLLDSAKVHPWLQKLGSVHPLAPETILFIHQIYSRIPLPEQPPQQRK